METKVCGVCKKTKQLDQFHKNPRKKDGVQSMCKECRKTYHRKHYLNNKQIYIDKAIRIRKSFREWFNELKSHYKCEICGEARWWVLEFHHEDKSKKDSDVSVLINEGNKEKVLSEISKCVVLCANCHRDLHYKLKIIDNAPEVLIDTWESSKLR
jgi:hypothetical protein